jgi:predicted aspartyl protease
VIIGTVNIDHVPMIMLNVNGRTWPALIDTGFNGDLELPDDLRLPVNARFVGRMRSLLAAGQVIEEDIYEVDFPFDGQMVIAEATFVPGSEILIGTHFIRRYRLEVNFVTQTVFLEQVAAPAS